MHNAARLTASARETIGNHGRVGPMAQRGHRDPMTVRRGWGWPAPGLVLLLLALTSWLSGCALAPGTSASAMRSVSSVPVPVLQDDVLVPENLKVRPINAELIIEQVNVSGGLRRAAASAQTVAVKVPDFGMLHQDYRLGPGDIISVIVWDHPELTIPAGEFRSAEAAGTLVAEDGTIFYPYVGVIHVAGMTVRE